MSRQKVTEYIKESSQKKSLEEHKVQKFRVFNHIELFIKDPFPDEIDLKNILEKLHKEIPEHFLSELDMILIGDFPALKEKEVDAMYAEGAIYLSNTPDSEEDLYDDLVHEIAHSLEGAYSMEIYADGQLEYEFVAKRKMLYHLLIQHGYQRSMLDFVNSDYNEEFDIFLYKKVGYDTIRNIAPNLFLSPYAATSLREYFANGFEALYLGQDRDYIKKVSPKLYEKLEQLYYMGRFDPETEMAYNMDDEKGWSNKHGY